MNKTNFTLKVTSQKNYIVFSILFLFSISGIAQNVYVSTSGNNSNSGTEALPWQTIQYAVDNINAGQTIFVRSGTYSEKIKFSGSTDSGTSGGGYVILQNYTGESPIIDGTGLTPVSREGIISVINASYVKIIGFEIRAFTTSSNSRTPVGIYVEGASHHLEIRNNIIHDIISTGSNGGAHGMGIFGTDATTAIHTLTIDNNEIYDCTLRWSEAMVLNGNVRDFVVSNNSVHDVDNISYDFIGFEGECGACGTSDQNNLDQARDGQVFNNIAFNVDTKDNPVYNNERSAAGFYVDGGKDIVFDRNIAHHCNLGFELASEHNGKATSGIIVRNNFVYKNHVLGITTGGYSNNRGDADNCTIVNNTFYQNNNSTRNQDDWGAEILLQSNNHNNIYKNNIVFADTNRPRVIEGNNTNTGNVFDYNLYFGSTTGTAPGTNSITNDPLLVNPNSGDLHISNSSPAINAGENLGSSIIGDFDFDGEARINNGTVDIGADEDDGEGNPPTVPNTPTDLVATTESTSQINLNWTDNSNNEDVFKLFRSLTGSGSWTKIATLNTNTTNYTDNGLSENTTYYYKVRAKNTFGSSSWSNKDNATTNDSGGGTDVTLHEGYFETGWDGWIDGGSDASLYTKGSRAYEGNNAIRLRDNSSTSTMTLGDFDVTSFNNIEINFYFYTVGMKNGHSFLVEFWDGATWNTVDTYTKPTDFSNSNFYNGIVTINSSNYTFSNATQFRFRCNAALNKNRIYIDQVIITASTLITNSQYSSTITNSPYRFILEVNDKQYMEELSLYPNPVSRILNIKMLETNENMTFRIFNILGIIVLKGNLNSQTIDIKNLQSGLYILEVNDGEEFITKRFIKK